MIVVCAGVSRSGSTVQYQIISEVVERVGVGIGNGVWNANKKLPPPSSRFYYIYKSEQALPDYLDKIDYSFATIRDPLDVAMSLYRYRLAKEYHQFTGLPHTIEDIAYVEMRKVINWIEFWEKNNAHLIKYEDIYMNKQGLIAQQAANILGFYVDEETIDDISAHYSIYENYKRTRQQNQWFDFTDTLLTLGHIGPNKGKPGQGKLLPDKIVAMITAYSKGFMERHDYL
jgi:hypothetical protein